MYFKIVNCTTGLRSKVYLSALYCKVVFFCIALFKNSRIKTGLHIKFLIIISILENILLSGTHHTVTT